MKKYDMKDNDKVYDMNEDKYLMKINDERMIAMIWNKIKERKL